MILFVTTFFRNAAKATDALLSMIFRYVERKIYDQNELAYFASPVNIPLFFGKPRFDTVAGIFAEEPPPVEGG